MSAKKKKTDPPNFEEALQNLEAIVGQLEDGSLGLNESLVEFENGMALLRQCHGLLENAEQKIEVLTSVNKDGDCLLYTSPSPRDRTRSRMPSSA